MQKTTGFRTMALALMLALSLGMTVAPSAEAVTYPENKCFIGFWDLNIFGIPYFEIDSDLLVVGKGRVCSLFFGKCGPLTITGTPTSTLTELTLSMNHIPWFNGGRIEGVGQAERKGPGGVMSGVIYVRDPFFTPTERYNGTFEGAQVPCP